MPQSRVDQADQLTTIDVERQMYGRRYTCLPVDTIDTTGFTIDCSTTYMRPALFDVQPGDMVRWKHKGKLVQGTISHVTRTATSLHATLDGVAPLPADFFAA